MKRRRFVRTLAGLLTARATTLELALGASAVGPRPSSRQSASGHAMTRVQMRDSPGNSGDADGPTWEYANRPLLAPWKNKGGDWRDANDVPQGKTPYATSKAISGLGSFAIDVTAVIERLMDENTGLYVRITKGLVKVASRNHGTLPGPRLRVATTAGIFDPPCIVDTWLSDTTVLPLGATELLEFPAILKFDLTAVTGTVTAATLTLNTAVLYQTPATFTVDYLDPPFLNAQGPVTVGIASAVAKDSDLVSHPSVLIYDNLVSKEYIKNNFDGFVPSPPTVEANVEIIDWPQYGLKAARCWSVTINQRVVAWHHWAEPKSNPPRRWQRNYGNGHEHLFLRYLLTIGEDLKDGMTEGGMKLPGMAGMYEWSTSGAKTLPEPPRDGVWEMRLCHTGLSPINEGWHRLGTYYYGVEAPASIYFGNGDPRGPMWSSGYLKAGRIHCIEQEIKLNTLSAEGPANANPDGVVRVWLDGVLVFERTDVRIRGYDRARIQDLPFLNVYHGGMGKPKAPFHYDIGGICVATERIGPPKLLVPAARAGSS